MLACGPGAVSSHRCAGALHAVRPTSRARFDVTVPTHRRPPGIDVHRCALTPAEITVVNGVPRTTLLRTIADLADVVPRDHTRKAIVRGDQLRLIDFPPPSTPRTAVAARACCARSSPTTQPRRR